MICYWDSDHQRHSQLAPPPHPLHSARTVRDPVPLVHQNAVADLRRTGAHHCGLGSVAYGPIRAMERSSAARPSLADAAYRHHPARDEVQFTDRDFLVTRLQPGPEWLAWRTRPMNTLLGIALGIALWFATRRIFSEGAANVALALFAFTPSLIAHFSVATTDGIGALFIFLIAVQLIRWRHRRTATQTALIGLLLGGLLLSKFYAPPLVLLALLLMLFISRDQTRLFSIRLNWRPALGALAIACWFCGPDISFTSRISRSATARFARLFLIARRAFGHRPPGCT